MAEFCITVKNQVTNLNQRLVTEEDFGAVKDALSLEFNLNAQNILILLASLITRRTYIKEQFGFVSAGFFQMPNDEEEEALKAAVHEAAVALADASLAIRGGYGMAEMAFNRNVKAAIERDGLCAADVARKAGFSPTVFYNILNCKRRVYADEVLPICRALGCTVDELFEEKGA